MAVPNPILAFVLLPAALFVSCAAPKAIVVEEPNQRKVEEPVAEVPEIEEPGLPDDGLRLPDMLTMPGDAEFRSTRPAPDEPGSGAVIARPPTDPPSRPKGED